MMNYGVFLSEISFLLAEIFVFFFSKTDDATYRLSSKIQNQEYIWKCWSDAAQTWHQ